MHQSGRLALVPRMILLMMFFNLIGALSGVLGQENLTPVLLSVHDAPVPFRGSDGSTHLVYELWLLNFSSADVAVEKVEAVADGRSVLSLDAQAVARRLQPAGMRESSGTLSKGSQAILFVHLSFLPGTPIPRALAHRLALHVSAAPPGHQEMNETGGDMVVDQRLVPVLGPPLRGDNYISADSCCDATRHTRAALPVNGHVWIAQRYAVDWEQLNQEGQIYSGARQKLEDYTIFGKGVYAVADGKVASITDGLPEQTPGVFPTNITLDEADGNAVILDLGNGLFAMYAHMQPGSLKVHRGDVVKRGQLLGLVGNSGNSIAPHLHFQVMNGPSSLSSNGFPYEIDHFVVNGKTAGTAAFDEAEGKGTKLEVAPVTPAQQVKQAMPLDQLIISFPTN